MYTAFYSSIAQLYDASLPKSSWDAKPLTAVAESTASPTRPALSSLRPIQPALAEASARCMSILMHSLYQPAQASHGIPCTPWISIAGTSEQSIS